MVALSKALSSIRPQLILVVGDLIVDRYIFGQSKRISPEAPVPVVLVEREEMRAGGSGNVALNLISMGVRPRMVGRIGDEASGRQLLASLRQEGVDTSGIFEESGFSTPMKTRVIASGQQLVRIDLETSSPLAPECEPSILSALPSLSRASRSLPSQTMPRGLFPTRSYGPSSTERESVPSLAFLIPRAQTFTSMRALPS